MTVCFRILTFDNMFRVFITLFLFLANPGLHRHAEQQISLKFMVKSGKTLTESWHALKDVFRQETMSRTQVNVWHR